MLGIDASIVLIVIPIVFIGILVVAAIGALDEKTRGDKLAKFFSIASNAAIFFTVLALLYQVVDSEEESRRTSYADVLDTYSEIMQMQVAHPEVWRLMYPEEEALRLGEEEALAQQHTYFIMNFFERLYSLYRDGDIDAQRWKTWESWIDYSLSTSPMFQNVWDDSCEMYHPAFVAYIEANYDDGVCGPSASQRDRITSVPGASPAG
jgi:hypothetical protein